MEVYMTHMQERIQFCIAKIIQNNPQVKNIFDEIYQQGGRVLLVGGAVRDCVLGCVGSDLDFEVYHLSFDELKDILEKFGKVCFVGKSFGVLRLQGFDADWSIPRRDSFGRKPTVELDPHMSFDQAFRRRDVTVNAMGIDVYSKELIDPFNGLIDLQHKILRSPDVSFFVQDPLRLFRVMQFVARFEMQVDQTLSQVCRGMDISEVSVERIEQEFSKLFLKSQKPSLGLKWLASIDRLVDIIPNIHFDQELYDSLDCLAQHDHINGQQRLIASWAFMAVRLNEAPLQYVTIHEKITPSQLHVLTAWLKRYIGSQDMVHQAALWAWYVRYIPILVQENNELAYKWFAHFLMPAGSIQALCEIAVCWWPEEMIEQCIHQARAATVLYHGQEPLLSGKDLISYAQGKELGELLKKAYQLQLEKSITDKNKLLAFVTKTA